MKLSLKEIINVVILALLTGLVAFSIDLYLPAFKIIAEDLSTNMGKVQISLSVFLAGLAVGQLFWGTLSDRLGRKIPLIIAISIYSLISIFILTTKTIGDFWIYRFVQGFSCAAGMVIALAVVKDLFDKSRTTSIFALLTLISEIVPIVAPIIGNQLLSDNSWRNIFIAMAIIGTFTTLLVIFLLPESHSPKKKSSADTQKKRSVLQSYLHVFKNRQFVIYTVVGSLTFSALMVYISNSPFLIMEKGGFTGTQYSFIFGAIAIGLMIGTYSVNPLIRFFTHKTIVTWVSALQVVIGVLLSISVYLQLPIVVTSVLLFLFLTLLGVLFPTTINLALEPFHNDSGTASAIFGFTQLAFTFIVSAIIGLMQNNSVLPMMLTLLGCAVVSLAFSINRESSQSKEILSSE